MTVSDGLSRRSMLMKLGILFDAAVGAILAVPIVRYILSPVTRERKPGYESWLSLGPLTQFPEGQTRLAAYRNPVVNPADGETANIPCWVIARISGAPSVGFRSPACLCVHAMVACTTRTVRAPPDRRSAACLNTASGWSRGTC
jgi:hypothetical protein